MITATINNNGHVLVSAYDDINDKTVEQTYIGFNKTESKQIFRDYLISVGF